MCPLDKKDRHSSGKIEKIQSSIAGRKLTISAYLEARIALQRLITPEKK